jgi:predicted DNA-binding transcriptional regulator AlpA
MPSLGNGRKQQQRLKIEEIGRALAECGFVALDEQAYVLGLSRSTAWTVLRGKHKSSGLSAMTINRMLATGRLPSRVRLTLLEYIAEKMSAVYGDRTHRLKAFASRISPVHMHAALFQGPKLDAVHQAEKQLLPGQHESLKVYENNAFGQSRGMRKQRRAL